MLIVAGWLQVSPSDREAYLAAVAPVTALARAADGCLEFVQAPDPLEPDRIVIYERWESREQLMAFRTSGGPEIEAPPIVGADVKSYEIASVGEP